MLLPLNNKPRMSIFTKQCNVLLADIADAKVNVCVCVKIIISSLKREGGERRRERERERERERFAFMRRVNLSIYSHANIDNHCAVAKQ